MNVVAEISIIDIAVVAILLFGAIRGGIRGFSGEIAGVIAALAAFGLAWLLTPVVAVWLAENSRLSERGAMALTFAMTAIAVILAGMLISYLLRSFIRMLIAKPLDTVIGVMAGILRVAFIIVIIFFVMNMVNNEYLNRHFGEDSITGRHISRRLPEEWRDNAEDLLQDGKRSISEALQGGKQEEPED